MCPRGPAVQLIDPDLLPAQVVRVPRVVLDVNPEISRGLLGFLRERRKRRKHRKRGRQAVRDRHGTGVDSNVCFYRPCVKTMCAPGAKNSNREIVAASVSLPAFSSHILHALHLRADNYVRDVLMKSQFESKSHRTSAEPIVQPSASD